MATKLTWQQEWEALVAENKRLHDKCVAEVERWKHDAEASMRLVKVQGARIYDLNAEVERLRAAFVASHSHVYAKPGCHACEVLGLPEE